VIPPTRDQMPGAMGFDRASDTVWIPRPDAGLEPARVRMRMHVRRLRGPMTTPAR
jgi:hypothetical protein